MWRRRLESLLEGAAWLLLVGLGVAAVLTWFDREPSLDRFWISLVYSVTYTGSIWLLVVPLMRLVAPLYWHWPAAPKVLAVLATLLAATATGCLIAGLFFVALGFYPLEYFWVAYQQGFKISVVVAVIWGGGGIFHEHTQARLEQTTLELKTKELERQKALHAATTARLASLESKVHPHFLFNALNSISSLIPEDPKRAEKLVERMSALLRFSLDAHGSGLVGLDQEMKIVGDYLEIEKVRFGERLRYQIEAPDQLDGFRVPPLSIQTLVENSVKHAAAPSRTGADVKVICQETNAELLVEVCDDGDGFEPDAIPAGHGLDNLNSRLNALYDQDHGLRIGRRRGWTVVGFTVPQTAAETASP